MIKIQSKNIRTQIEPDVHGIFFMAKIGKRTYSASTLPLLLKMVIKDQVFYRPNKESVIIEFPLNLLD